MRRVLSLWEVAPDVRVTFPSVQWPELCSCLPSPPEPVCWLELVGFLFFELFSTFCCYPTELPGAMFINKEESTVIAAICLLSTPT